jgi:hypothetical protein
LEVLVLATVNDTATSTTPTVVVAALAPPGRRHATAAMAHAIRRRLISASRYL